VSNINLASPKAVRLASLSNGALFLRTSSRHGHEIGMIFSDQGVLVLTGPDQFHAFRRMPAHANQTVVPIATVNDISLWIPPSHAFETRASVALGRLLIDEEGAHITARSDGDGAYVRVRLDCLAHDARFSGFEIDRWELATSDRFGNRSVIVSYG
jgi:hypothetical protein